MLVADLLKSIRHVNGKTGVREGETEDKVEDEVDEKKHEDKDKTQG